MRKREDIVVELIVYMKALPPGDNPAFDAKAAQVDALLRELGRELGHSEEKITWSVRGREVAVIARVTDALEKALRTWLRASRKNAPFDHRRLRSDCFLGAVVSVCGGEATELVSDATIPSIGDIVRRVTTLGDWRGAGASSA